jgi:glycerophosphoryl diester phosphodiesterase
VTVRAVGHPVRVATPIRIAAHRGVHHDAPENSLAAFEAAVRLGADAIEFDVRLSRDLVPMVTHDVELGRSLGSDGLVFQRTAAELRSIPLRGADAGSPQLMPTLDDVLASFAGRIGLEIELKDPVPELIPAVASRLDRHRAHWGSIEVTSFEHTILMHLARAVAGPLRTCVLVQPAEPWMTPPIVAYVAGGKARLAGASAAHLHPTQLDPEAVATLRAAGVDVHAWAVNDEATFERVVRLGITQCDTDVPERMLELRTRLAAGAV